LFGLAFVLPGIDLCRPEALTASYWGLHGKFTQNFNRPGEILVEQLMMLFRCNIAYL
jgi:hypothetical protein